jgi:hypothetical protein
MISAASLLLFAACAPPDAPVGSAPEIRLIYPTDSTVLFAEPSKKGGATCSVHTFIAVDVLNFTFVAPSPDQEVVEGQGHFHVDAGTSSVRPHELFAEDGVFDGVACPDADDETQTLRIRSYLVNAAHEDINDSDEHEDVAEPQLLLAVD